MKQKLFIALYTTGVVAAVLLLYIVVTTIKRNPVTPITPEEKADITLAQYAERPNSTTTYGTSNIPILLSEYLFPNKDPLVPGCSLRFSFAPISKAVEPGGTVNYAITLVNRGKETCENVSLSEYYSSEESFVASNPKPTASDYYWAIGNLGAGKEYKISLTTRTTTPDGGTMNAEACATADNSSDVCAQNVIFVQSGSSKTNTLANTVQKLNVPAIAGEVWGKLFNKKEFGIWVWDTPPKMTSAYAQQVVSVAKQNGFNVIYLSIDDYIPVAEMDAGANQTKQKANYMKALSLFVQAAKSQGIDVDVVGGAKNWSLPENRWKGYALIDFVKEYNTQYPNSKVRNLQYDVEPYLLPDYDGDKATILKQYVEFIDESARRMQNVSAGFSIVIPHFYDKDQKWTPPIEYNGQTAYAYTQLLRVLAKKDKTEIIIMAYRNFFDGDNGTKQISESEIKEASDGSYTTKVVVAQETGDVPPAYVTFHDYPKSSLLNELSQTQNYFGKYKNFGGTGVHYFDSFLKLK